MDKTQTLIEQVGMAYLFKAPRGAKEWLLFVADQIDVLAKAGWSLQDLAGALRGASGMVDSLAGRVPPQEPPKPPAEPPVPPDTPEPPTPQPGPPVDAIDLSQATILNSPDDLASWPVTTRIEELDIRPDGIRIAFSKKDGEGRWPDITPPGWDGPLQYTLGMCLQIAGHWYASAVIQFWHGLDRSGGPPQEFAKNWFYAADRWWPMTKHQPAVGEMIGFFVVAGDCRNNPHGTLSPIKERSNVVLVPMPSPTGATYTFKEPV